MNYPALRRHQASTAESNLRDENKRVQDFWTRSYLLVGSATVVGGIYISVLWLVGLVPLAFFLSKIEAAVAFERKLEAEQRIAEAICSHSIDRNVTRQIPLEGFSNYLDMFVELPEKQFFLISVRAPGEGQVFYDEKRETICFRRRKRSGITRYDRPDLIVEAKEHEIWIRKNRRDLFGGSSRDSRRPAFRLLVFAKPTEIRSMPESLYDKVGNLNILHIRNSKGSTYILSEEQVCDFLVVKTL